MKRKQYFMHRIFRNPETCFNDDPGGEGAGSGAPSEQEIVDRMSAPTGTYDDEPKPADTPPADDTPPAGDPPPTDQPPTDPPPADTPPEFTPNAMWDYLKGQLGEEFKVPEGLTSENEMQHIIDTIYENTQVDNDINDPFVANYLKAKGEEGFELEKYLSKLSENYNVRNLGGKDLIKHDLVKQYGMKSDENPRGWTDEELTDYIEKLSVGDVKAKELEILKKYEEQDKVDQQTLTDQKATERSNLIKTMQDETKKDLDELFGKTKNYKDIYGIETSEAEIESFNKTFETLAMPNEDGLMPITKALQDNEVLYKLAYILQKGENYFKDYLSDSKETTKQDTLDRLDLNIQRQEGGNKGPQEVDVTKLMMPDQSNQ